MSNSPIHAVIERWHAHMRGELVNGLDQLLHEDVVFYSPIVFTPQRGKAITMLYLQAAGQTLPGEKPKKEPGKDVGDSPKGFRYTKEILDGYNAVLEFETTVEGKYVNGIDMITCDDNGKIIEFRVLIRPLQAINLVHKQMGEMLDKMKK
jgi:hypothetical protein